jgi:hypothetical protein
MKIVPNTRAKTSDHIVISVGQMVMQTEANGNVTASSPKAIKISSKSFNQRREVYRTYRHTWQTTLKQGYKVREKVTHHHSGTRSRQLMLICRPSDTKKTTLGILGHETCVNIRLFPRRRIQSELDWCPEMNHGVCHRCWNRQEW